MRKKMNMYSETGCSVDITRYKPELFHVQSSELTGIKKQISLSDISDHHAVVNKIETKQVSADVRFPVTGRIHNHNKISVQLLSSITIRTGLCFGRGRFLLQAPTIKHHQQTKQAGMCRMYIERINTDLNVFQSTH